MTLNQITYFVQVAKLENYRQAADQLHVSQPSLSRSIANLEEELQIDLFEKQGRGVVLTKAGKLFLESANRILDECKAAQTKMSEISTGGGVIAIGYVFPLAGSFIPTHVRSFLSAPGNDQVSFQFTQNHTPFLVEKIEKGQLDVGFGGCVDHIDLEYFPVVSQELVIITPLDHPLASQKEVSFAQLEQYPVIGYDHHSWMGIHTKALYKEFDVHPSIIIECPDEYSIISLVRQNFGIALIPRTDLLNDMHDFSVHKIKGHQLAHQIYMFWKKDGERLPAVKGFIDYMKEQSLRENNSHKASLTYLKDIIHYESNRL